MNFIEKHNKLLAVAICLCAAGPILSTVHAYEVQPGWHDDGQTAYYITEDHQRATGLMEIEDATYYFGGNGEMQTGWQNVKNDIFYFDENGQAVTGQTRIQGMAFNFQDDGILKQGWDEDSYYNEKGFREFSSWIKENGSKYYVDEDGLKVADASAEIDGDEYRFNSDGEVIVGTFSIDDKEYHTDDTGAVLKNVFFEDDGYLYATEDGSINKEPEREINGMVYNFGEDGKLLMQLPLQKVEVEVPVKDEDPAPEESEAEQQTPAEPEVEITPEPVEEEEHEIMIIPAEDPTYSPEVWSPDVFEGIYNEQVNEPEWNEEPAYQEPVAEEPTWEEPAWDEPVQDEFFEDYYEDQNFGEWYEEEVNYTTDVASTVLGAAYAQLGAHQDCTALVSNALAAAGINFHGWPDDYASLGTYTANPVPGDLIIYSGHIAVYAGNGQAIHGGWNGYDTVIASVNCSQALIGYIHIG